MHYSSQSMRQVTAEGVNIEDDQIFSTYLEKSYAGHLRVPSVMAWDQTGDKLAVGETFIELWSFEGVLSKEKTANIKAHESNIEVLKWGNKNLMGSMSRDLIKFWDVRDSSTFKLQKTEKKSTADLVSFSFSNSTTEAGLMVALCAKDNSVSVFDFRKTSTPVATVLLKQCNSSFELTKAEWDPTNSVLLCAGGDTSFGSLILCETVKYEPVPEGSLGLHCAKITDMCFSPCGIKLATAGEDALLQILAVPDLVCQKSFTSKSDCCFRNVSFSSDSVYVAASTDGPSIDIYNTVRGGLSYRIKCSLAQQSIAWHPRLPILAFTDDGQSKQKSQAKGQVFYLHMFQK